MSASSLASLTAHFATHTLDRRENSSRRPNLATGSEVEHFVAVSYQRRHPYLANLWCCVYKVEQAVVELGSGGLGTQTGAVAMIMRGGWRGRGKGKDMEWGKR